MKKSAAALLLLILLLTMGCTGQVRSSFEEKDLNTVPGIELGRVVQDGNMLTYTLSNHSGETMWYGAEIRLETEKRGEWYKVQPVADFTAEIYGLSSSSEKGMRLNLGSFKDMKSGTHRLIKTFYLTEYNELRKMEEPGKEMYHVSCEFEIKK